MGGEGVFEDADEGSWQGNVVDAECISKEWCHLFVSESGDATSDARHEKHLVGVRLSICNKFVNIRAYLIDTTMHCRDGVAVACHADSDSPFCSEVLVGNACRSTSMHSGQVASKDEDFSVA